MPCILTPYKRCDNLVAHMKVLQYLFCLEVRSALFNHLPFYMYVGSANFQLKVCIVI